MPDSLPVQETLQRKEMVLNFGPQHPATHGVLRVVLELDSEYVRYAEMHYGYLHRGIEKLAEARTYDQIVPITDRLDYLASFFNEYAFVHAVEQMLGIEVPERAEYIRVILMEMCRIASHLMWLGAFCIDLGAITPIFYCFRERERLLDFFEMVTGARMTFNYFRIGGVRDDLPEGFCEQVERFFAEEYYKNIRDYETLLRKNRIFLHRTKGVGVITLEEAINFGLSGPSLRGSGLAHDLRKRAPYAVYDELDFDVPAFPEGDVYARWQVRMEELYQSGRIIQQALKKMPKKGEVMSRDARVAKPSKEHIFDNVESLIQYCYIAMEGVSLPAGEVYAGIEGPRGEIGFYIVSDGSNKPYRLFVRCPTFINLTPTPYLSEGRLIADMAVILGSFDPVMGEVDK